MEANKIIGLIYGGKSGEHDVSLQTALAVIQAFDYTKYKVKPFYITQQGMWRTADLLTEPVEHIEQLKLGDQTEDQALAIHPLFQQQGKAVQADHTENKHDGIDLIFPLLHGTFGEDGTIQGLLEMANIPYVGAGVLASAVGMDKVMMKKIFAHEGLPQCEYTYFTRQQWNKEQAKHIADIEQQLGYPCFVKPANLGSSVGISKAYDREQLLSAVSHALQFDRKVIVEQHIDGREIEISILGNDDPKASIPGEVIATSDFYDYHAKYVDGNTALVIPPENLSLALQEELQTLAIQAFQAIDGSGLARVDFFVRHSDEQVMINEINTMPGFTPFSMYPLLWLESGKSYQQLLDDLIAFALERYNEKQAIHISSSASSS